MPTPMLTGQWASVSSSVKWADNTHCPGRGPGGPRCLEFGPKGSNTSKDPKGSFLLHFKALQGGNRGWALEAPFSHRVIHLPGRLLSQAWLCCVCSASRPKHNHWAQGTRGGGAGEPNAEEVLPPSHHLPAGQGPPYAGFSVGVAGCPESSSWL